ncbi:unnamed protein product [Mesocestoides corti]|uniref:Enkurin domain-containing protein n=2 Tax=Mesocestoides corti TaxID=53468 RepID=A0A3P6I252_MESCO|nr:unnamed protein product [Mesocestoides corti]
MDDREMELIYNLLPVTPPVEVKRKRYQSTFSPMVRNEVLESKVGKCRTMGPAAHKRPNPKNFLRSHTLHNLRKTTSSDKQTTICSGRKPPLPNLALEPAENKAVKVDFVARNRICAQLEDAVEPTPIIVDSKNGDKFPLQGSGLTKEFIYKKNFGRTPDYLEKRKTDKRLTEELYSRYREEVERQQEIPRLSMEEREKLLDSLKKRHSQVYGDYLRLSVVIDTLHKKQRKERLERELDELERDIRTITEHKIILLVD